VETGFSGAQTYAVGGYGNWSRHSTKALNWAALSNTYPLTVLPQHFKYTDVALGRNDISGARTLSQFESNLDSIVALLNQTATRVVLTCPTPSASTTDGATYTAKNYPSIADDYICWFESCNGLHGTNFTNAGARQRYSVAQVWYIDRILEYKSGSNPLVVSNGTNIVPKAWTKDVSDVVQASTSSTVTGTISAPTNEPTWNDHSLVFTSGSMAGQLFEIKSAASTVITSNQGMGSAPPVGSNYDVRRVFLPSSDAIHPGSWGHIMLAANAATFSNIVGDPTVALPNY
jgi:hypothetical protein